MNSDWPALIRLAALRLHIPPEAFWRLSVKEWAALTAEPAPDALGRKGLKALMAAHPDFSPPPVEGGGAGGGVHRRI